MNEKSKNQETRIISDAVEKAIPLVADATPPDTSHRPTRSINQKIIPFADFTDQAQPLQKGPTDSAPPTDQPGEK